MIATPLTKRERQPRLQRETFRTSRLLDFASEKELISQTGHRPALWPLVVVKELVDNAIDACEEADIAPSIVITADRTGITVADNGPGIPAATVKGVLDFTVRVSSREAYVSPTRGAQGNALKCIVAMPYVIDGERGEIEIEARGIQHHIVMSVDRVRQEPVIQHEERKCKVKAGTVVRVPWRDLKKALRALYSAQWISRQASRRNSTTGTIPSTYRCLPSCPACWPRGGFARIAAALVTLHSITSSISRFTHCVRGTQ